MKKEIPISEKILITGPGRSGTTFLMHLLTLLDYATGIDKNNIEGSMLKDTRGGMEPEINQDDWTNLNREMFNRIAPVMKAPLFGPEIMRLVNEGHVRFRHIILPIRYMPEAAKSRVDVNLHWLIERTGDKKAEYYEQTQVMYWVCGKVVEACALLDIPLTILAFPRLVEDPDYCYAKMKECFTNLKKSEFKKVFKQIANPKQIQTKTDDDYWKKFYANK